MQDFTVADVVREYLEDAELRGARALDSLQRYARKMIEFCGGEPANGISTSRLRDFQLYLREKGYAPGSINLYVKMFRTALRFAEANGRIDRAPLSPRRLIEPGPRQGFIEEPDFRAIAAELPEWAADIFAFAFYSGWRRSECLQLRWSEVDFSEMIVRLAPHRTKTSEQRALPIAGGVEEVITRRLGARVVGVPWVFHRRVRGEVRPVNRTSFRDAFVPACKRAGRPGVYLHDARRSAARDLVRAGIPEDVAMRFTGHKTRWIFSRYNIVSTKDMEAAAIALKKFRGNGLTEMLSECKHGGVMDAGELKRILDSLGITAREFAAELGVHESTVSRWLSATIPIPQRSAKYIRLHVENRKPVKA